MEKQFAVINTRYNANEFSDFNVMQHMVLTKCKGVLNLAVNRKVINGGELLTEVNKQYSLALTEELKKLLKYAKRSGAAKKRLFKYISANAFNDVEVYEEYINFEF